jgi:hypothetical protein
MFKTLKLDRWFFLYSTKKLRFEWVLKLTKHGANSENLIIFFYGGVGFHRNGFSTNGLFIECTISSSFQNCKQNLCSTSTSKVIDDLVGVTL